MNVSLFAHKGHSVPLLKSANLGNTRNLQNRFNTLSFKGSDTLELTAREIEERHKIVCMANKTLDRARSWRKKVEDTILPDSFGMYERVYSGNEVIRSYKKLGEDVMQGTFCEKNRVITTVFDPYSFGSKTGERRISSIEIKNTSTSQTDKYYFSKSGALEGASIGCKVGLFNSQIDAIYEYDERNTLTHYVEDAKVKDTTRQIVKCTKNMYF